MITIHVFKSWSEASRSKFGPSIRHWPNLVKKDGKEIERVIIAEGVGKGNVSVSAVQTDSSDDKSIAALVVEVFAAVVRKDRSTMV